MTHISPYIQAKMCEVIFALLNETGLQLSNFKQFLNFLDRYRDEIPEVLNSELRDIVDNCVKSDTNVHDVFCFEKLPEERQRDLVERLLAIYIDLKGGSLIY